MNRAKRYETGKAGNYIVHLKKLFRLGQILKVILYCRVSRCSQSKNGNLEDQRRYLLRMIREYEKMYNIKIEVVAVFVETASGWARDRDILEKAALMAKDCNAVVVTESSCRLVRSRRYINTKPDVLPDNHEYANLMIDTEGVTLATILHPDTSWKKVKGFHTKRGQRSKNKYGGRRLKRYAGYKKAIRKKKLPLVLQYFNKGYSKAEIVRKTGIARSTIVDWIDKYK